MLKFSVRNPVKWFSRFPVPSIVAAIWVSMWPRWELVVNVYYSSICGLAIMPMKAGFHLVFTFVLNCSYFLVLKVTTLSSVIAMFLSTSIRIPLSKTISATKQKWKSGINLAIWSYGRNGLHRTTLHIQNFCGELICPTQVPSSQFHVYFVILFVSHKFK